MSNRLELRDQVRDVLSESKGNLPDDTLNNMISRATAKLNRDLVVDGRSVPRQMLASATVTTDSSGVLTLPSDWLKPRSVKIDDDVYRYVSQDRLYLTDNPADTDVALVYAARLAELTDTTSNWLLDIAPDTYVYAACLQYSVWNSEDQRSGAFLRWYEDGVQDLGKSNSSRPIGSMVQQKRPNYRGFYTVFGDTMRFGNL